MTQPEDRHANVRGLELTAYRAHEQPYRLARLAQWLQSIHDVCAKTSTDASPIMRLHDQSGHFMAVVDCRGEGRWISHDLYRAIMDTDPEGREPSTTCVVLVRDDGNVDMTSDDPDIAVEYWAYPLSAFGGDPTIPEWLAELASTQARECWDAMNDATARSDEDRGRMATLPGNVVPMHRNPNR